MRLRVRRLGGLAGVKLGADVDTDDLPGGHSPALDHALRGLAWGSESAAPHPDAFRYELTKLDDPARPSVIVGEHEVPSELHPLLDAAKEGGEIES
jgi:emfourin